MMGENSKIAWTDHTFNPWIGCQKVSAGCLNCYAEKLAKFHGWVDDWGKDYRRTSEDNWKKPIQWAKKAVGNGVFRRVFCASLADIFDPNIPDEWRDDFWELLWLLSPIKEGGLEWLILTKRPENISKMIPDDLRRFENIRIGITAENQEMAQIRMPIFLDAWTGKNFISWEPALSPITDEIPFTDNLIDWVIAGSESGSNARPCNIEWMRDMRDQCQNANIPFFLKQMPVNGKLTVLPELDGKVWNQFPGEN
jgi:protein gp37